MDVSEMYVLVLEWAGELLRSEVRLYSPCTGNLGWKVWPLYSE
jgi:hypothetical protein